MRGREGGPAFSAQTHTSSHPLHPQHFSPPPLYRPSWGAQLHTFTPHLHHIGIEGLRLEFAFRQFNGHHREHGYNAVFFSRVANSWVRDEGGEDGP